MNDPELLELLKEYDHYIDDYISFPVFNVYYLNHNQVTSINLSCNTEKIPINRFDSFIREVGMKNYIFVYSVKYGSDKSTILFRFSQLSIEYELQKYQKKKRMIIRDEKIKKILND